MERLFLAIFFTVATVSPVHAQSTLALQEKCAEGAKKFFFQRINLYGGAWGNFSNEKALGSNSFTSHYNKKLDRCFIRIEWFYVPKDKKEDAPINSGIEVFDVFAGKNIACFWRDQHKNYDWPVTRCEVETKSCTNEQEFKNLVSPYMEE